MWETIEHAASLFAAIGAKGIGIHETPPVDASRVDAILEDATGKEWNYRVKAQGIDVTGSGVGVFWRTDQIALVQDLGHVDVDTLPSGFVYP